MLALAALAFTSTFQPPAAPAGPVRKPTLKVSDYGKWERLGPGIISDDGRWYASRVTTVAGSSTLTLRAVDGPEKWAITEGTGAAFSDDSKWFGATIGYSRAQSEQMAEQRRPREPKLTLRSLPGGEETTYERVARWEFLKGGRYVAIQHLGPASPPGQPPSGAAGDFQLVDLTTKEAMPLASVSSFQAHKSGLLSLQVTSPSGAKGLQILNSGTGLLKTLAWGKADLRSVTWAKDVPAVAWLESVKDEKKEGDDHKVKIATDLTGTTATYTLDTKVIEGFPKGSRVADFRGIQISPDASALVLGIKEWEDKEGPGPRPSSLSNVEIWNTKDTTVLPLQKTQAAQEANRTDAVIWRIKENKGRIFLNKNDDLAELADDLSVAYYLDNKKHASPVKVNGIEYADLWMVDTTTGEKELVLEKMPSNVSSLGLGTMSFSPTSRYMTWFAGKDWHLYDSKSGTKKTITTGFKDAFVDHLDDRTLPEKTPWTSARWSLKDQSLFVMDEYDLYRYSLRNGDFSKLTNGASKKLRSLPVDLDTNPDGLDESEGLFVTLNDIDTMGMGVGKIENGTVKNLFFEEKAIIGFRRSKGTDRVLFRRSSFEDSPNDYVTNLAFSAAKPLTKTNPQQSEYAWGKAEMIHYKSKIGGDLKGILYYPANYQPGRSYPMVTYIYERLSQDFHAYLAPNPEDYYDLQHFVQNGYFVLQPDIAYKGRNPGLSAVECVETAVRTVLAKRIGVDGSKLGLMGHSWGAYQTVFIATQSKLFSAYVAGAPLTELVTMSNSFYWNWGQSNQVIFESSQGRFDVPFYEDIKSFIDNSPLYHAKNVTAPLLIEAGTADGAVDWTQSQFLYNTMRRMGKAMTLLVYPGENHGLANPANMKDFTMRMQHFFDVHLKSTKPMPWLKDGVPFIKQDEERARIAKP